jgi:hypothetical protein
MSAEASPGWEIVLAGARFPTDEASFRRSVLSADRHDWRRAADMAWQHRVAPLLYAAIRSDASLRVPEAARRRLKQAYLATAARNSVLFRQLKGILEAFHAAGIPVIVLKGALLADTVYRERALRPMNDIDLLIREEDLEEAEDRLGRLGYEAAHDPETKDVLRRRHHHWVFRNAAPVLSGIPLELHWRLDPPGSPFRVDTAALWQRAVPARIAGVDALGLSPEDLLLHLCTHAARHRFNGGLIPLCDIAAVTTRYGDRIDWAQLGTRAAEWGAAPYVAVALNLASELVGAAVPASIPAELRGSQGDSDLLDLARERVLEEKGTLRMAAELRLRWRGSGAKERIEALRRIFWPKTVTGNGSAKPPSPVSLGTRLGRYFPLTWALLRHPRAVAAVARREARKSRLDSWCSGRSEGSGADAG